MPHRWESSGRPLFVKTVFVNGNRHAILSQEDPFLRSGISSSKKHSRPDSSLSFGSDLFFSGSESSEERKVKRKDVSSDLQSCCRLIKLRLASTVREDKIKSKDEVGFDCGEEEEEEEKKETRNLDRGSWKQKRKKWHRSKTCRNSSEESLTENGLMEYKTGRDRHYYVYNFDGNKGKKNYCFVKISSKPSQLVVNCSCGNGFCGSKGSTAPDRRNLLISATFHNLIMSSGKGEKLLRNSTDYVFSFGDPDARVGWNNCVGGSCYNSLAERVLQWLDMSNKRRMREKKAASLDIDLSVGRTERIFVGETFLDESDKTRQLSKTNNKPTEKEREGEDVETEVKGEAHVKTILSRKKLNSSRETLGQEGPHCTPTTIPHLDCSNDSGTNHFNNWVSNLERSSVNEENFFLKEGGQSRRRPHRNKGDLPRQKEEGEGVDTDDEDLKFRERQAYRRTEVFGKVESFGEMVTRYRRINPGCETQILTQEFTEKRQKSINNPNITRSRTVFSQNLSSPQQQEHMSWLREGKAVRTSDRDMGRPQLHIFMPTIPVRDPEESLSESESFLGDVG